MARFNRAVLSNGLTIIHEERDVPVTTVMMGVQYGAMYESEEEKGISHFMEHLCFKGTEKRTTEEVAKELESKGGELNAFTSEEMTAYHVRLPSKHLEIAIDVIGDIFFNPIFPLEDVEREGNVICEEIKMYRDNPRAHSALMLKNDLYEKPFGMSILGTESTVKAMTQSQLLEKHRAIYTPENSVLCVVGSNSFGDVLKFAKKYTNMSRVGKKLNSLNVIKKSSSGSEKRHGLLQANLCLGAHFPELTSDKRYAAEVFNAILGEGMSSRLFMEVREKEGLVYGVKSVLDLGRNYGYLEIWAGCDPPNKDKVIEIAKREFANMKNLTKAELKVAKEQVISKAIINSEGSDAEAIELINEEFATKAENLYDFEDNVNSVTLEDVQDLAKDAKFSEFWVGP
ncbi:hypothetical protein CMI41_02855 [Candidatus Pacearchaeota archaeon]|nr:hypothetical protein [Candidatus Pacearchaeota archaeon]|tara:strand:+ start:10104 stop:11300 length:1197 start_codon:yes stop_codon:yes gene_type:complete